MSGLKRCVVIMTGDCCPRGSSGDRVTRVGAPDRTPRTTKICQVMTSHGGGWNRVALQSLRKRGIRRFPIVDRGNLVGIIPRVPAAFPGTPVKGRGRTRLRPLVPVLPEIHKRDERTATHHMVTHAAITEAAALLKGKIIRTPLVYSPTFSAMTGAEVYLKLETMQKAGSFKVRGAAYKILSQQSSIGRNGVIAASAGNHAQGVAVAAGITGIPATIVMPAWVSPSKQEATAGYGATIILEGSTLQESIEYAMNRAASGDMTFIHPYDDEAVIAGQGTVGLEILEDLPEVDMVIAPIGGGGLIAGIATAVKENGSAVRVVGVQSSACPSAVSALRAGEPVTIESDQTVADGIRVTRTGISTYPIIRNLVEEVVLVDDEDIISAVFALLERKKVLAEGAGAAPLAALLSGKVPYRPGEKVVLVIGGGNVDAFLLEKILRKGLFEAGRILQCIIELPEGPQSLPSLFSLLARENGVIVRVEQERGSGDLPLYLVRVALEMEVRNRDHQERILSALKDDGYEVTPVRVPRYSFFEFSHTVGG